MKFDHNHNTITLTWEGDANEPEDRAEIAQALILVEALQVYAERNPKYNDNWRRMGWRGCLVRIRERAERLWDDFWDAPVIEGTPRALTEEPHDADDALDLINFAAFMVRAVRGETTRDGSWW